MSQIRADNITNRQGTGAPIFVNGIRVTGLTSISNMVANTGTFSGAVSIGGTLTYEDVTNVDSVGIVTARNGVKVTGGDIDLTSGNVNINADNAKLNIGASADISIYHDGNDSFISGDVTTTDVFLRSKKDLTLQAGDNAGGYRNVIYADNNGDVRLYNISSNAEKLRTTSSGVKVTGGYTENIVAVSGTAVDCATGSYFTKTITGATTFTFTNVPSGVAYAFTFEVTLNGSNAITWPSSVKWPADTAPTITDGKTQVFVFLTDDGGTRWRGSSLVDYTN